MISSYKIVVDLFFSWFSVLVPEFLLSTNITVVEIICLRYKKNVFLHSIQPLDGGIVYQFHICHFAMFWLTFSNSILIHLNYWVLADFSVVTFVLGNSNSLSILMQFTKSFLIERFRKLRHSSLWKKKPLKLIPKPTTK